MARFRSLFWWSCFLSGAMMLAAAPRAEAQLQRREYPPLDYYAAFGFLEDGEFQRSIRAFHSAGRGGIRSSEGRWVDTICYDAMQGEALYRLGQRAQALERFTSALNLFLAYQHWMLRVEFPAAVEADNRVLPGGWTVTGRNTRPGRFPDRYPVLQGRFDNEQVVRRGGVIALPEYILVNAHEVARCTALALRRRREIMGQACAHDPLTQQLLQSLSVRPAAPNHWSQAWIDVQLGIASASAGHTAQAVAQLGNGVSIHGQIDHPLTATALIELGRIAVEKDQYSEAARFFVEASISAMQFGNYVEVEEALRRATQARLMAQTPGNFALLEVATAWASRERMQLLEVSTMLSAAEIQAAHGQTAAAAALLDRGRRRMARTDMMAGQVGARFHFLMALTNYQNANLAAGDTAFANLMRFQTQSSARLYEINLVDRLYTSGTVTKRVANELYAKVLREPDPRDWRQDPAETLSVVMTPLQAPLERWFELALERKEYEVAVEVADRIRRHRFYTSLPMGGRLLSLRWVLAAPAGMLHEKAGLQRRELFERYPRFAELAQRVKTLRQRLVRGPLVPEGDEARRAQKAILDELGALSTRQELMLRAIALERAPGDFVFPPPLDFKRTQAQLKEGQLVLSFLSTGRHVHAFVMGRDLYQNWRIDAPGKVRRDVAQLLRAVGHIDRNQPVDPKDLASDAWRELGSAVLARLTNHAKPGVWDSFDELIIVPDGPLWYVPFEALPIPEGSGTVPLIAKIRVRYVPTVSLVLPGERSISPVAETAVVAGQLYPRNDGAVADSAFEDLQRVLPRVTRLNAPLPAPSGLFSSICDRVVVLQDIDDRARDPYDWSPLQVDRSKPGSSLAHWMSLPWGNTQQIVLPGFHTPAETALKNGGTGNEIFLSVCGLMASGARTVMISRWRTGGQSAYDLVREFVQELPYTTAADAWQRSVELMMESDLVVDREPRIKPGKIEASPRADHPFFWAGYLVVDTGHAPVAEERKPDDAVALELKSGGE